MAAERRKPRLHLRPEPLAALLSGLAALGVSLLLLWYLWPRTPMVGSFTRVGGSTRVETAIEAARFWTGEAAAIVTLPADAPKKVAEAAARCAIAVDAPLLFESRMRRRLVAAAIAGLSDDAELARYEFDGEDDNANLDRCMANGRQTNLRVLSTFRAAEAPFDIPGIRARAGLSPVVVFAAAKAPLDAPDVAVGMALAAHLADGRRQVSLVVLPRYLEANPDLERALRDQEDDVRSSVVLGQAGVLSEDTRTLLRQMFSPVDRRGFVGELKTALSSLGPVLAALLGLIGIGAAGVAAPAVARNVREGRSMARQGDGGKTTPGVGEGAPSGAPSGASAAAVGAALVAGVNPGSEVTVWLRSGGRVTGIAARSGEGASDASGVLRLGHAQIVRRDYAPEAQREAVLVPVEDIVLIEVRALPEPPEERKAEEQEKPPQDGEAAQEGEAAHEGTPPRQAQPEPPPATQARHTRIERLVPPSTMRPQE